MYTVSTDFKNAIKDISRRLKATVTDGSDPIIEANDLISVEIISEGNLCRTVMRQANIKYFAESHDYLEDYLNIQIGVVLPDTSTEYIDYGDFKVVEISEVMAGGIVTAKAYDRMYEAMKRWDLEPTYPLTTLELVEDICTELGWTCAVTSFPNDDIEIDQDLFIDDQMSYRQVLNMIAEASGSIIYFNEDDELDFKQVSESIEETLATSELVTLNLESEYGELNTVTLSRMPQEDNITEQDATSVATYGVNELKIENNYIVDDDRETYITPIYNELNGIKYYPSDSTTIGLGYFQVGDRIKLTDLSSNEYEIVITGITLNLSGGLKERIVSVAPDKGVTNYDYAGIIGTKIKNTEIIVDKQDGEIQLLVDDTTQIKQDAESILLTAQTAQDTADDNADDISDLSDDITSLELRADGLEIDVQGIGGANLLVNGTGLKGTLTEWQEFDEDGDLVDSDNDGTVVSTSDIEENTESGSGIKIEEQFITQTVNTIVGESYTLYFRFKALNDLDLYLTGVAGALEPTSGSYTDETWEVYKYEFTATDTETTVKLDNTDSGTGSYAIICDTVLKKGTVSGWIQAPNEVYGKNFRFDTEGFSVTSNTDNFRATLDNTKLGIYDTSGGSDRNVALFSKDDGLITSLTAQDEFTVQRYENSAKATRFIPTSTGLIITVNN